MSMVIEPVVQKPRVIGHMSGIMRGKYIAANSINVRHSGNAPEGFTNIR